MTDIYIKTHMNKIVRLTESDLHSMIKEAISDILSKKYLYHSILRLEDLPNIVKNGLMPKNWDRIFFSDGKDYNGRCTALLGIELNDRNIEKYRISYYKGVSYACKYPIDPCDIELIDCRIGEGLDWQPLMASVWLEYKVTNLPIEEIADFCNNISVKLFYEDVCEYFFGVEKTRKLKQLNIPFRKLGI